MSTPSEPASPVPGCAIGDDGRLTRATRRTAPYLAERAMWPLYSAEMAAAEGQADRSAPPRDLVRRVSSVGWLRRFLLLPVIARPGYWFATVCGFIWGAILGRFHIKREGGVIVASHMPSWRSDAAAPPSARSTSHLDQRDAAHPAARGGASRPVEEVRPLVHPALRRGRTGCAAQPASKSRQASSSVGTDEAGRHHHGCELRHRSRRCGRDRSGGLAGRRRRTRSPAHRARWRSAVGGDLFLVDYDRLDDVRRLAGELLQRYDRIDVLANNAGGLVRKRAKTADGFERTIQHNHLAPFLLTRRLLPC